MRDVRRLWLGLALCAALAAQPDPRFEALSKSLAEKDFPRAEALLQELIGAYPAEPAFRERLGVVLLRRGALPEAEAQLAEAVRMQPQAAAPRLALARAHWLQGERDEAEALLAEAGRLGATDPAVQQALALFRGQTGDAEAAVAALEKAVELAPRNRALRAQLAQLYLDHRTPEGALRVAEAGLALTPEDSELLRLRGLAQYGLGESQAALESFLAAIDADPSSELAHASLETLLPEAGPLLPAAIERLESFSLDSTQSPIGPYLLALATLVRDPQAERAGPLLREAVRRAPEFWPAWFELHRSLERQGDVAGAIAALEKVTALNPDFPAAHYALAKLYAEAGEREKAMAARKEHHRLMTERRAAEQRRRQAQPKLAVND